MSYWFSNYAKGLIITFLVLMPLAISVSSSTSLAKCSADDPLTIINVSRSPAKPYEGVNVTIIAQVQSSAEIAHVDLHYRVDGSSWTVTEMTLCDKYYVGTIPSYKKGTTVWYKVYAYDVEGNYAESPEYSYTVAEPKAEEKRTEINQVYFPGVPFISDAVTWAVKNRDIVMGVGVLLIIVGACVTFIERRKRHYSEW